MHDYAWSTHVGDCRLPPDDAAALLAKCLTVSYKVVDPVTKQTKKITTVHQGTTTVETVEVGFWYAKHNSICRVHLMADILNGGGKYHAQGKSLRFDCAQLLSCD
eukprot:SAG31_NODE_2277_length_6027_cov_4.019062_8_plen_105_part_00